MNFLYTVDEYAEEPIMLINKHIGYDGIMGDQFQSELYSLDSGRYGEKKCVKVLINSEGGSVKEAFSIYNAILHTKCKVDTFNVGMAASAAGLIMQAGRTRHMSDYAFLMMHMPYTSGGSKEDKAALDTFSNSCATMLANKSGKTPDDIKAMMAKETWMNAEECLDAGFCDVIEVSKEFNKRRMQQAPTTNARFAIANQIINQSFPINKKSMSTEIGIKSRLTAMFNLNADASDESIAAELGKLSQTAEASKLKVDGYKNQVVDLNNRLEAEKTASATAINQLKADHTTVINKLNEDHTAALAAKDTLYNALKTDMDNKLVDYAKLKKDKEDAEAAATLEKATNMVTNFAKVGRIKNEKESIDKWVNLAIKDFDGTKTMIEDLPLNQKSVKIENKNTTHTASISAASIMGEIQARKQAV